MQRRVEKRAQAKPERLPAIISCVFVREVMPATALLMVGLTVFLLIQGWQLTREKRGEIKPR